MVCLWWWWWGVVHARTSGYSQHKDANRIGESKPLYDHASNWYEFVKRKLCTFQFPISCHLAIQYVSQSFWVPRGVYKILPDSSPGLKRLLSWELLQQEKQPLLSTCWGPVWPIWVCPVWCGACSALCLLCPLFAFHCALCEPHVWPVFTMYQVLCMPCSLP